MTEEESTMIVEAMGVIPFFPSAPAAQSLIGDELRSMCASPDQAMWLVRRLSQLFPKWPGMQEMRAVFCSKFQPCDGIDANSATFLDGVPSEKESRAALPPGKPVLKLPAGATASADPESERQIIELTTARAMPPVKVFRTISEDEARVDTQLRNMHRLKEGE